MIKDVLLPLVSYPTPVMPEAIASVAAFAGQFGAHLKATALEIDLGPGLYFEGADIGEFLAAETAKSHRNAEQLLAAVRAAAEQHGIACHARIEKCAISEAGGRLVDDGRISDLCIVPVRRGDESDRAIAERVIFASGRPVLLLPAGASRPHVGAMERVAIAWDSSRSAARALADAMPLLRRAAHIRILTVSNDKPLESFRTAIDLAAHLSHHAITVEIDEVRTARGQTIGDTFRSYVSRHAIDLLVMGAYGHTRLREFVLGGATRSILTDPPCWTLLSHG